MGQALVCPAPSRGAPSGAGCGDACSPLGGRSPQVVRTGRAWPAAPRVLPQILLGPALARGHGAWSVPWAAGGTVVSGPPWTGTCPRRPCHRSQLGEWLPRPTCSLHAAPSVPADVTRRWRRCRPWPFGPLPGRLFMAGPRADALQPRLALLPVPLSPPWFGSDAPAPDGRHRRCPGCSWCLGCGLFSSMEVEDADTSFRCDWTARGKWERETFC